MSALHPTKSHRFVVVWRHEPREIAGAAQDWRGWVMRVPDPSQSEFSGKEDERIAVRSLDEVPTAMRSLIKRSGDVQEEAARRSQFPGGR